MQNDGNLVMYDMGRPLWNSNSDHRNIKDGLHIRGDGNLVLYNKAGGIEWESYTAGNPGGTTLIVQDDRNVVLYDSKGNALWSTGTENYEDCK